MRRCKIVCTLGPASSSIERIRELVAAGMDCARLNFSHGSHEDHAHVASLVRQASAEIGKPVALLADLSGPKMRVGRFPGGPIVLVPGARFTLTTREVPGDVNIVSVTYKPLPQDVVPGNRVLLDDGLLNLEVVEIVGDTDVVCKVIVGGTLSNNKGLNLPGAKLSAPALTEKDIVDLEFAVGTIDVDYVALSFVRTPEDVLQAKRLARGKPVIAKIEKPEAIDCLGAILDAADGAMVARGDLGVEMGAERVPLIQKRIIREVNNRGKIVITATQMLDSMIRNPSPTRAEANDVANAVLDQTDAVMLSGETASGSYPIESVQMMDLIITEVEKAWLAGEAGPQIERDVLPPEPWPGWEFAHAAARAATLMARALPLKAIVTFTTEGRTAQLLSEYRPRAPIIAITPHRHVASRLALEWGVAARVEVPPEHSEEVLRIACSLLVREKICAHGDAIAIVAGWPPSGGSNTVKLHRL